MNETVVHQFMGQRATHTCAIKEWHGNMNVVLVDKAAATCRMNTFTMEIGHVLVIIILFREQQDHVFAIFRLPNRIFEGQRDAFQNPFGKGKDSVSGGSVQCRKENEL